ncbi:hypothetical protein M1446_01515 [Candidatus Dependentiae bacterium]|nr:hypothetical protein [Candidatus Dependentiae bacterium]
MKVFRLLIVFIINSIFACPICIDRLSENDVPFFMRKSQNINETSNSTVSQSDEISKLKKILVGSSLFKGRKR